MNTEDLNSTPEGEFEQKLYLSLKMSGYLFPTNVKSIDAIESLYGNTEINVPQKFESFDNFINEKNNSFDFGSFLNKAAFSSNNINLLDISEDSEQDSEDNEEA